MPMRVAGIPITVVGLIVIIRGRSRFDLRQSRLHSPQRRRPIMPMGMPGVPITVVGSIVIIRTGLARTGRLTDQPHRLRADLRFRGPLRPDQERNARAHDQQTEARPQPIPVSTHRDNRHLFYPPPAAVFEFLSAAAGTRGVSLLFTHSPDTTHPTPRLALSKTARATAQTDEKNHPRELPAPRTAIFPSAGAGALPPTVPTRGILFPGKKACPTASILLFYKWHFFTSHKRLFHG
jgi:hypothetical protein